MFSSAARVRTVLVASSCSAASSVTAIWDRERASLPLYPELRDCPSPSAQRIFETSRACRATPSAIASVIPFRSSSPNSTGSRPGTGAARHRDDRVQLIGRTSVEKCQISLVRHEEREISREQSVNCRSIIQAIR
jgi:hypothetical protein